MMTELGNEKTDSRVLEYLCFEADKNKMEYSHIELEAKGWIVRYKETLKSYFIEPILYPTARIKINTVDDLHAAFILITGKNFNL
jgi:hypothetical protein